MDEIDAALDRINASIVAYYIKVIGLISLIQLPLSAQFDWMFYVNCRRTLAQWEEADAFGWSIVTIRQMV